jgi:transcriptional regulator with XRE-family HTH domain
MGLLDTLGKRIKALRADRGVSQKDLARRIDTAQSHLSEIEADGVPRVSGDLLARIASGLNTTTDYLLLLTDDPQPGRTVVEQTIDPQLMVLWQRVLALPTHLREPAATYLQQQLATFEKLFASVERESS